MGPVTSFEALISMKILVGWMHMHKHNSDVYTLRLKNLHQYSLVRLWVSGAATGSMLR